MANENEQFELQTTELDIDYEQLLDLESSLEDNLKDIAEHIDQLDIDRDKLQNNEYLQESIENIVWEQVQLQLAAQIGEEFIKDNNGQTLDLRKEAHIQTAENFEKGKVATHNRDVNYQERYDRWQDNFTTNKKGERVLKSDAREFFDKGRDKGSGAVHKDHTVSIKEQLNDIEMSTFFSKEEVKDFANSSKNLHDLDASANMSKGDKTMKEFLDSERNGLKPDERFNIDRKQLEKDDREAREELHKRKQENKEKAIQSGKKSRRDEALKVSGKALKVAIFQLLSEFLKEIIKKFIVWLGEKHKNFNSFLEKLKEAVSTFVSNLSKHILIVGQSILTMLVTSIFGTVGEVFLKIWTFMKQGWSSLKDAIDYLNNPENSSKNINIIILELGKIITAGIIVTGGVALGETIGKSLIAIAPPLAVEIPILGSLASIIGTFMGATVAGITGAFVLKMIDQQILEKQIAELSSEKIDQKNEMLVIQDQLLDVKNIKLEVEKNTIINTIKERHDIAASIMKEKLSDIFTEPTRDDKSDFDEIDSLLQELLD
jgi:cation diffusion facilitator family transporter